MSDWRPVRLDWVTADRRKSVNATQLGGEMVFHYSIPALDEFGDGRVESAAEVGSNKLLLRGGEVLVSRLNPRITRVLVPEAHSEPTIASTEFIVLVPSPAIDRRFLCYLLQSESTRQFLDGATMSVTRSQQRVRPDVLTKMWLRLPEAPQQCAIADYLDRETARIDALIAHRQRMAELVVERWDAVIRRATRLGLHADRLVRQSGVPWIGDAPEGWLVLPLRRVGRLMAGAAFPDAEQGRDDGPIPYFKVADFNAPENGEYLTVAENTVTLDIARALHSPIYPASAVVFPKIGAALLSNRRRLLAKASCTDQNVMGLVVSRGHPRFYYYLLQSFDFGRLRMPGPVPLLNEADAASILVPVPPDEEQTAIVTHLDARAASVGRALGALDQQLSRLQERRAALIAAAITGELEIPEVAA